MFNPQCKVTSLNYSDIEAKKGGVKAANSYKTKPAKEFVLEGKKHQKARRGTMTKECHDCRKVKSLKPDSK
jgi:hypothetical protein